MSFGESIKTCLTKYVDFTGRARRSEFWWWFLTVTVVNWILFYALVGPDYFEEVTSTSPDLSKYSSGLSLVSLIGLATLLPSLAVIWRRLHDTDKPGPYYFVALIPLIGLILLLVWWATEGTRGPNRFGPDPKQA